MEISEACGNTMSHVIRLGQMEDHRSTYLRSSVVTPLGSIRRIKDFVSVADGIRFGGSYFCMQRKPGNGDSMVMAAGRVLGPFEWGALGITEPVSCDSG